MEELRVDNCPKNDDVVEDDDDRPMLSSQALAALQEFFAEQTQAVETDRTETESETVTLVSEDWRLSQFWYDAETAETVAKEVVSLCGGADSDCRVACIACPTLYAYLKKIGPDVSAQLLEFDKRFEQYGTDFTFYDYNLPEDLPLELKHTFSIIVADPPYLVASNTRDSQVNVDCPSSTVTALIELIELIEPVQVIWLKDMSKECLEKVSQTTSFLARPGNSYLLLLTGEVQRDRAAELLGLRPCGFRPQHSSKLGNEFRLFTNYDPGMRLGGWEQEN
ncbi:hypothetical protein EZV62_015878 [Acer yangbiense]|uniref:Protein-lysine N-methyltransferase EZV62_015878 n=1 Tax=Acer yangbiense TaxID=1000413 RepID=A0A5C7HML4_9ROSI|nr:hypothetical protein EZV62_015878 [Acer yangbiense]